MQIPGPLIPPIPSAVLSKVPEPVVEALRVGQVVTATALTPQQGGTAIINLQGALVQAQTSLPLSPGQTLQLEVTQQAQQALMRVIPQESANANQAKPPAIQLLLPTPNPQLLQWKGGQVIAANIGPAPQKGQMSLDLAGWKITTKNQLPPQLAQPGQSLKLEVIRPGAPAALKVLNIQAPAPNSPLLIQQAIRSELPKQAPLSPLLANLRSVAAQEAAPQAIKPNRNLPPLPQPIIDLAKRIVAEIPTRENIRSGDGLKQAVQQSGVFLEPQLARFAQQAQTNQTPTQPLPTPTGDGKAAILNLLLSLFTLTKAQPKSTHPSAIQATAPPPFPHLPPQPQARAAATLTAQMTTQQALLELLRQTEGSLARIHLNQLASLPVEEDGKRTWVTEMPIRHGEQQDVIQLRIEEQDGGGSGDKDRNKQWSVTLALDLDRLGPLRVRVTLLDGHVSATFWAEAEQTTQLFQQHLQALQAQLDKAGLKVGNLSALQGQMPVAATSTTPQSYVLLDEEV